MYREAGESLATPDSLKRCPQLPHAGQSAPLNERAPALRASRRRWRISEASSPLSCSFRASAATLSGCSSHSRQLHDQCLSQTPHLSQEVDAAEPCDPSIGRDLLVEIEERQLILDDSGEQARCARQPSLSQESLKATEPERFAVGFQSRTWHVVYPQRGSGPQLNASSNRGVGELFPAAPSPGRSCPRIH